MARRSWIRDVAAVGLGVVLARKALRARRRISFSDRVCIVTGGSRGLGLVIARQLVDEGARVALLARHEGELERARQGLLERRPDARVLAVRCDVSDANGTEDAIQTVARRWGGVDVLLNVAGVIQVGPLEHMRLSDFEHAMEVHFWGPLHAMRAVLPYMRRSGSGRIVNVASIGGLIGVPHLAPYCASKFALVGLSDSVRAELGKDGIQVTTVCPGLMRTGSAVASAAFKGRHLEEFAWFAVSSSIPLLTVSAEKAARQILDACRHGDAALTITPQACLASIADRIFPGVVAWGARQAARLLPAPGGPAGDHLREAHDLHREWGPNIATRLSETAAVRNNEPLGPSGDGWIPGPQSDDVIRHPS